MIADSSTLAMPSITSPSAGMISPAVTTTWSPTSSFELGSSSIVPSASRLRAVVSARVLRSVAACALPRPSAIASAKLAKRTVNQSHAATLPAKTFAFVVASPRSLKKRIVANAAPTSVTNMTGLRAIRRGSSLRKLSRAAGAAICGIEDGSGGLGAHRVRCSRTGPRETTGKYVSPTTVRITARSSTTKSGVFGGERAGGRRYRLLAGERARDREHGDDQEEAAEQHRQPERRVVPVGVPGQAAEGRAVVVRGRRERVDHLGEPVRAGVEDRRLRVGEDDRDRREAEDEQRHRDQVHDDELHLGGLDLLADVLRRPADHQPGDEDGEQREDEDRVEAGADAAGADLAEHHVHERHGAAERREAVVRRS